MGASTRGEIIRVNRKLKGWSQTELADKVGVSRNMVSLWETDASDLSIRNAIALAQALDVNLAEIILGEETEMNAATKEALEREIIKLSDQVDTVQSVTINIEDQSIISLDVAITALVFAFFATAMGIRAVFPHTTSNLICCWFFAIMGIVVLIFGKKIVRTLDKQLKERSQNK